MNEIAIENSSQKQKSESIINILGFSLPVISLLIACALTFLPHWSFTIQKPLILLAGSLIAIIPFRNDNIITLQRIIIFYLFSIIVNQIISQYFSFTILSINISYSTIILLLCTIGFLLGKINSITTETAQEDKNTNIISGWIITFAILIIHMIFLSIILKKVYGYGYEHNLLALGNICLYFLLFLTLWQKLKELRFRQVFSLVLNIFFIIYIVKNF